MSIFGEIKGDNSVEQAVLASLRGWLPTYLIEVALQEGGGSGGVPDHPASPPLSYQSVRDRPQRWTEQAMPAIVVQVGGTIAVTRKASKYRVVYGVQVAAIVAGPTREDTRRIASTYSAALASALTQHGDLGGFADGCEWTDTDYSTISDERTRTLMAAVVSFDVAVNDVLDVNAGPDGPPPPPDETVPGLPNYGETEHVIIDAIIATTGAP